MSIRHAEGCSIARREQFHEALDKVRYDDIDIAVIAEAVPYEYEVTGGGLPSCCGGPRLGERVSQLGSDMAVVIGWSLLGAAGLGIFGVALSALATLLNEPGGLDTLGRSYWAALFLFGGLIAGVVCIPLVLVTMWQIVRFHGWPAAKARVRRSIWYTGRFL
jgi:hypothetical protein